MDKTGQLIMGLKPQTVEIRDLLIMSKGVIYQKQYFNKINIVTDGSSNLETVSLVDYVY